MIRILFVISSEIKILQRIQSGLFTFNLKDFCTNLKELVITSSARFYPENKMKESRRSVELAVVGIKTNDYYTKLVFNPLYMKLI